MSAETVVALIAAMAGIGVAGVNYVGKRRSDAALAQLQEAQDSSKAQREYEYEARRRLYAEFQPLMFQFVELADGAYWRLHGIARSARQGRLQPGSGRFRVDSEEYLPETIYRLMSPLVLFKLFQRRLTVVDLSLDSQIYGLYMIAKVLYRTWNGGKDVAEAGKHLSYEPYGETADRGPEDDPKVSCRQHMNLRRVDALVEAMTIRDESIDSMRCQTFAEFRGAYRDKKSSERGAIAPFVELLTDFHPRDRPVLWRLLIVQAHLYKAALETFTGTAEGLINPRFAFTSDERMKFDWRSESEQDIQGAVEEPFEAAEEYLASRLDMFGRVAEKVGPDSEASASASSRARRWRP